MNEKKDRHDGRETDTVTQTDTDDKRQVDRLKEKRTKRESEGFGEAVEKSEHV